MGLEVPLGNDEALGLLVPGGADAVDSYDVAPFDGLLLLRHKISRK